MLKLGSVNNMVKHTALVLLRSSRYYTLVLGKSGVWTEVSGAVSLLISAFNSQATGTYEAIAWYEQAW